MSDVTPRTINTRFSGIHPCYLTGSGEATPICFVDAYKAYADYGATIHQSSGPCPNCKATVAQELHFNPFNSYYVFICPVCLTVIRWLNNLEQVDDLKVIKSGKNTALDIDTDFPNNGWL